MTDLSIVIPVGPGDDAWRGLVDQLFAITPPAQILLVFADGDPACSVVPEHCVALSAPPGRAHQLNAGIAAAEGAWLWLLHADSRLRDDTLAALRDAMAMQAHALGWFRLVFTDDGPWLMPLNALGANLRARWLGLPFGDQGFLLRREDAARLGPFDATLAFGEDHAWVWRARRLGLPLQPLAGSLATSARKYADLGWLRTTLRHLRLTARQAREQASKR